MRLSFFPAIAALLLHAIPASADPIAYDVTVNTSTISGTAGSLDFNFNPGPLLSQGASLQVMAFTSNGVAVGAPQTVGDVSGALPATVTFDNGSGLNDYFQGFTFGSSLSFRILFYGPALSSPDGTSTSGSTFAFSMFSDSTGTTPALTTDTIDGFAIIGNVNLDGTTTITNFSPETSVAPSVSAVPEPNYIVLTTVVTALMTALRCKRTSGPTLAGRQHLQT